MYEVHIKHRDAKAMKDKITNMKRSRKPATSGLNGTGDGITDRKQNSRFVA